MAKRKLVLTGNSTTVAIPRVMLEHIDRRAGDYVILSIQGDSLIIKADKIPDNLKKDPKYCTACSTNRNKCADCHNQSEYTNKFLNL